MGDNEIVVSPEYRLIILGCQRTFTFFKKEGIQLFSPRKEIKSAKYCL
ncbi:hypothetical protein ACA081_00155 [Candidatus Hodgkinia cicadicola]